MHSACQRAGRHVQGLANLQVTPMLGLLSSLRERRLLANKNGLEGSGPEKIIFIWANRNPVNFNLLDDDILAEARSASQLGKRFHDMQNDLSTYLSSSLMTVEKMAHG